MESYSRSTFWSALKGDEEEAERALDSQLGHLLWWFSLALKGRIDDPVERAQAAAECVGMVWERRTRLDLREEFSLWEIVREVTFGRRKSSEPDQDREKIPYGASVPETDHDVSTWEAPLEPGPPPMWAWAEVRRMASVENGDPRQERFSALMRDLLFLEGFLTPEDAAAIYVLANAMAWNTHHLADLRLAIVREGATVAIRAVSQGRQLTVRYRTEDGFLRTERTMSGGLEIGPWVSSIDLHSDGIWLRTGFIPGEITSFRRRAS